METAKKQWWGLLVIPLELIIGDFLFPLLKIDQNPKVSLIATATLFIIGFLIMLYLFHDFLRTQWQVYRQKLFRHLLLSIILVIGAFLILNMVRGLIPSDLLQVRNTATDDTAAPSLSAGWAVLAAVIPFIAPFAEELTFRYLLFGKFTNKILRFVMLFVQGILFGLVHWNNFNGNIYAMIPYMVLGIYFGLIYWFFKNIWGSIMVHWMLNTMNSLLPALFLLILSLFGIQT